MMKRGVIGSVFENEGGLVFSNCLDDTISAAICQVFFHTFLLGITARAAGDSSAAGCVPAARTADDGAAVLYLFDGEGWSEERCEVAAEGGVLAVAVDGEVAYRVTLAGEVRLLE